MSSTPNFANAAIIAAGMLETAAPVFAKEPGLTTTAIKIGMFGTLSGPSMA